MYTWQRLFPCCLFPLACRDCLLWWIFAWEFLGLFPASCAIGIHFIKSLSTPRSCRCWPVFLSTFRGLGLLLRSLAHFDILYCCRMKDLYQFQSACENPVFTAPFVEEAAYSPIHVFGTFQGLGDCHCVGVLLGPLFCSIGLRVYFHAVNTLTIKCGWNLYFINSLRIACNVL